MANDFGPLLEFFRRVHPHKWARQALARLARERPPGLEQGSLEDLERVLNLPEDDFPNPDWTFGRGHYNFAGRQESFEALIAIDPGGILASLRFPQWRSAFQTYKWVAGQATSDSIKEEGSAKERLVEFLIESTLEVAPSWSSWLNIEDAKKSAASSGLFLEFAQLSIDRESISTFANRYGNIGIGSTSVLIAADPHIDGVVEGTSFDEWSKQVIRMKDFVALWKALRDQDIVFLDGRVKQLWRTNIVQYFSPHRPKRVYAGWLASDDSFKLDFDPIFSDAEFRALVVLRHEFSSWLQQWSPQVNLRGKRLTFSLETKGLLVEMWRHFAESVAHGATLRSCPECGLWFSPGAERNSRRDKKYCSVTCRGRGHTKRKRQILEQGGADQSQV